MQNKNHMQVKHERVVNEYKKTILTWDKNLKEWRKIVPLVLKHASINKMNVSHETYGAILALKKEETGNGVNMIIVQAVTHTFENTDPSTMGISEEEYYERLLLNQEVGKRWRALAEPIHDRIERELEIERGIPTQHIIGKA